MIVLVIIGILALDIATKYWAFHYLQPVGSIPVIENIFHLTYVENPGAAFGILQDQRWVFIIATVLTLGFIVWFLRNMDPDIKLLRWGLALIVAGAIGNLIDRILLGYVIDFLDFRVWPVFNVADISVVVGTGLTILVILFYDRVLEKGL